MSSKLNKPMADLIHKLRHATERDIAAAIGIHRLTLSRWKHKGELLKEKSASQLTAKDKLFINVYDSLTAAPVELLNACVERIAAASEKNWQAAAWWLERRYPLMFGRKVVFNPNQMEDYLRTHYGEKVTEQVLEVLENAARQQPSVGSGGQASTRDESGRGGDTDNGENALEAVVDAVPRGDSTLAPEQKYSELEAE